MTHQFPDLPEDLCWAAGCAVCKEETRRRVADKVRRFFERHPEMRKDEA